eukprot:8778682-Pyramimonas_sp.AAC.1
MRTSLLRVIGVSFYYCRTMSTKRVGGVPKWRAGGVRANPVPSVDAADVSLDAKPTRKPRRVGNKLFGVMARV